MDDSVDDKGKDLELQKVADETILKRLSVQEVQQMMQHVQALWDEVDQRNTIMKLDPDYDLYQKLQDENVWFFYLAEYKGSKSFYSFFIQPSLHVKGSKQLVSDFIYVDPKHRGSGVADILIFAAEKAAQGLGANLSLVTLKSFDRHDTLMQKLGYEIYENSFQKVI